MRGRIFAIAAGAGLAACGQASDDNAAINAPANAAAPAKKHPTYCFFKDAATKGWAASAGAGGNVAVKGKVHLDDRRYSGDLSQSDVTGDTASVWVTMAPNTTGFGAEDNWWDVSVTIPNSAAVKAVTVLCGTKTVAKLPVRR
jgi:hypothetical protein